MKGYIHLYTGNGKGKTTAAIGLAVRAAGAGKKTYIAQFVKGMHYCELDSLKRFSEIEIHQFGLDCFIVNEPTQKDIDAARHGLNTVSAIISNKQYDVIILDEVCIALYYKLFSMVEFLDVLKLKPDETEIVMTGRYATQQLMDVADLATEMKEVKHYYSCGVEARKGIEF